MEAWNRGSENLELSTIALGEKLVLFWGCRDAIVVL